MPPTLIDGVDSSSAYTSLLRITTSLQKPSSPTEPRPIDPSPMAVAETNPSRAGLGNMLTAATPSFLRGLSSRNQTVAGVPTTGVEHPLQSSPVVGLSGLSMN